MSRISSSAKHDDVRKWIRPWHYLLPILSYADGPAFFLSIALLSSSASVICAALVFPNLDSMDFGGWRAYQGAWLAGWTLLFSVYCVIRRRAKLVPVIIVMLALGLLSVCVVGRAIYFRQHWSLTYLHNFERISAGRYQWCVGNERWYDVRGQSGSGLQQ